MGPLNICRKLTGLDQNGPHFMIGLEPQATPDHLWKIQVF